MPDLPRTDPLFDRETHINQNQIDETLHTPALNMYSQQQEIKTKNDQGPIDVSHTPRKTETAVSELRSPSDDAAPNSPDPNTPLGPTQENWTDRPVMRRTPIVLGQLLLEPQSERTDDPAAPDLPLLLTGDLPVRQHRKVAFTSVEEAIIKQPGPMVVARVFARKYRNLSMTQIVTAMSNLMASTGSPNNLGQYKVVSGGTKVFFKCPPSLLHPEALGKFPYSLEEYTEFFYCQCESPASSGPRDWQNYVNKIMEASPYNTVDARRDASYPSPQNQGQYRTYSDSESDNNTQPPVTIQPQYRPEGNTHLGQAQLNTGGPGSQPGDLYADIPIKSEMPDADENQNACNLYSMVPGSSS